MVCGDYDDQNAELRDGIASALATGALSAVFSDLIGSEVEKQSMGDSWNSGLVCS